MTAAGHATSATSPSAYGASISASWRRSLTSTRRRSPVSASKRWRSARRDRDPHASPPGGRPRRRPDASDDAVAADVEVDEGVAPDRPRRASPRASMPPRRAGRALAGRRARASAGGSSTPSRPSAGHEVHRRRADEAARRTRFAGCAPELVGRRRPAAARPSRSTATRSPSAERLGLVVRDVHHRAPDPLVQQLQLGSHLHAQLGVEVRERLVEQEDVRLADERPGERDALPLASRELARPARRAARRSRRASAASRTRSRASRLGHVAHERARSAMFSATVRCGKSA